MNILEHNREAWNRESAQGSDWSTPVSPEEIAKARQGEWSVILTPILPVPADWFGEIRGKDVLCLASGGGQQAPILAAAGATVTSFDLSDEQLAKDRLVAEREGLALRCIRGDMADLSVFDDASFDLIFNAASTCFVPDVEIVWRECHRVLRPGGELLTGFVNPSFYLFDHENAEIDGKLEVCYSLPFAEPESLRGKELKRWQDAGHAAQFSHSLDSQIGGQLAAGFVITGLYEDAWSDEATPLNKYSPTSIATRARR